MALDLILITDSFKEWFDKHNILTNYVNNTASVLEINTSGTTVNLFGYINASGAVVPAQADNVLTYSDCFVVFSALSGFAINSGSINAVVEGSLTIIAGDKMYLSDTEPGKVTNVSTGQYLGKATAADDTGTVTMWYTG